MDIVKGGEWSSAGKTKLAIGLAGPITLDNSSSCPVSPARGEVMDVDTENGAKMLTRTLSKPKSRDFGFCVCGMPFDKPKMVLCVGLVST